jgi:hypothetical protein
MALSIIRSLHLELQVLNEEQVAPQSTPEYSTDYTNILKSPQNGKKIKYPDPNM